MMDGRIEATETTLVHTTLPHISEHQNIILHLCSFFKHHQSLSAFSLNWLRGQNVVPDTFGQTMLSKK